MTGQREVPVAPLREAFLRSGLSASELARRLGWTCERPDVMRVARQLGLRPQGKHYRDTTSHERAVEIARAIGVDPTEVEL